MPDESKPRTRRTPEQIAKEELAKAKDRRDKAIKRRDALNADLKAAQAEVERAQRFHDYAAKNPDLPEQHEPEDYKDRLRAVADNPQA